MKIVYMKVNAPTSSPKQTTFKSLPPTHKVAFELRSLYRKISKKFV